jgi:cytochrome c
MFGSSRLRVKITLLLLVISGQSGNALASTAVERGKLFVEMNCARCHAIGPEGSSPYPPAPPFRTLHERYDVGDLAEAFAEGIIVAHNGPKQMPQFMLGPEQIDDLIAWLRSVQSGPPPRK